LKDLFIHLDKDKNNSITSDEISQVLNQLGIDMESSMRNSQEIIKMIDISDKN